MGWMIEAAGAIVATFPDESFGRGKVTRFGIWVTPTYRMEKPFFDFLGVARFIHDKENSQENNVFDIGGRILWQHKEFALSIESVERFIQNDSAQNNNTTRVCGVLEYRLEDNIYLTASFGKNYNANTGGRGNLISLLGITFNFGQTPSLR